MIVWLYNCINSNCTLFIILVKWKRLLMVTKAYKDRFNKNFFESSAWQLNNLVCGIDEVGRGCLAGPVVTGAVILYPHKKSRLIKDSKLLTQEELAVAYSWVVKNSWFSFAIISARDIDKYNIYHATLRAMKRAVMQLLSNCPQAPSQIVIDAMPLNLMGTPYEHIDVFHFPFGESKSISIAAASIVAKVKRDQLMRTIAPSFPPYHFARHKGYSTKLHQEAVKKHGRIIIHRIKFLENKHFTQPEIGNPDGDQQTLC